MTTSKCCDLLIIGSGPAGMAAAINGASEGLNVCLMEGNNILGGQARESNAIENYPGFPDGITGNNLMNLFVRQADKFNTTIYCPLIAQQLRREGNRLIVTADDYSEYRAKAVLIAIGLSYRRLQIDGLSAFLGNGVYYGLPPHLSNTKRKCTTIIVGGANSAGQAALKLLQNPHTKVVMLIRRRIVDGMSTYLIERLKDMPNFELREGQTLASVCISKEDTTFTGVTLSDGSQIHASSMHIFIGAAPKTLWLQGTLQLDEKKYINTGNDVTGVDGWTPRPYETSMRGVFAAGDVRVGSIKRVASAIGEGASVLQVIHQHLASLQEKE